VLFLVSGFLLTTTISRVNLSWPIIKQTKTTQTTGCELNQRLFWKEITVFTCCAMYEYMSKMTKQTCDVIYFLERCSRTACALDDGRLTAALKNETWLDSGLFDNLKKKN
jgi:hypothetical protein